MPKPTLKEKRVMTIDVVKKWLVTNCKKGERVSVLQSPTAIVIHRINQDDFQFAYKRVPNNKK
jgi:hypothetical protein